MSSIGSSQHVCSYLRGMNWHTYNYLDTRLHELSRYITLAPENKDTWSEALADLLILTGSAVDSFFRYMGGCPYIQVDPNYQRVEKEVLSRRNKNWNIHDFRRVYESFYELSHNIVDIPFGLSSYGSIQPFSRFNIPNEVPVWWNAYNKLKHTYYSHLTDANLDNVLNALGGLLILNTLHKCSQEYLIMNGLLKSPHQVISPILILDMLKECRIGYPKGKPLFGCQIKTSIFIFNLREE